RHRQFVVEAGGGPVVELDVRHRQRRAFVFHVSVAESALPQPFDPSRFAPHDVRAVVGDAHLVGLGEPDADGGVAHDPPRSGAAAELAATALAGAYPCRTSAATTLRSTTDMAS